MKWSKAVEKRGWETVNHDLTKILEQQLGTAKKKMERMRDIIYQYGEERFGVKEKRNSKATSTPTKSRRQQEIERQLRKQWKKASDTARDGLMLLQGDILTGNLAKSRELAETLQEEGRHKGTVL